jgi:DedD protein
LHDLSDRALKERIIGAVVLVIVAVLVVPVFLDGPSGDEEIVSQTVTLPGQNDQERKQQTIVLERDREQPVPVSRAPTPTHVPSRAAPAAREQDSAPAAQPKPAAPPQTDSEPAAEPAVAKAGEASATGMWAVQLGSFSSQENAERLAASLREQGYAAFLSQLESNGQQLHRVRVGPQKDRESAEAIAAQLAKSGHSGQVVPHP